MPPFNATRRRFTQGVTALGTLPWLMSCNSDDVPGVELEYADAVQQMISTYFLPGVLAAVRRPGDFVGRVRCHHLDAGRPAELGR